MHDEWIAGDRSYLSEGSMAKLHDTSDDEDLAAIGSGE
jgi:putative transposase